jgi:hypothetical protein
MRRSSGVRVAHLGPTGQPDQAPLPSAPFGRCVGKIAAGMITAGIARVSEAKMVGGPGGDVP